jgi:hypothetical protein
VKARVRNVPPELCVLASFCAPFSYRSEKILSSSDVSRRALRSKSIGGPSASALHKAREQGIWMERTACFLSGAGISEARKAGQPSVEAEPYST